MSLIDLLIGTLIGVAKLFGKGENREKNLLLISFYLFN